MDVSKYGRYCSFLAMEPFTFASSTDLKVSVSVKMYVELIRLKNEC